MFSSNFLISPQIKVTEVCIDENEKLIQINRLPGENDIGMVAWNMELMTPEYPHGREIMVVANDLTHMIGSFALTEDMLYYVSNESCLVLTFVFL